MDSLPPSAPAAMDTRSNKEIPVWRGVGMDREKKASTELTHPAVINQSKDPST